MEKIKIVIIEDEFVIAEDIQSNLELLDYDVSVSKHKKSDNFIHAGLRICVLDQEHFGSGFGCGPVDALNKALKSSLSSTFPVLNKVRLIDYKVRVVSGTKGTAAVVRVFVRSTDGDRIWDTVGVSEDIIEASWQAIVDSYEYIIF